LVWNDPKDSVIVELLEVEELFCFIGSDVVLLLRLPQISYSIEQV